jgi:hypothetical protein
MSDDHATQQSPAHAADPALWDYSDEHGSWHARVGDYNLSVSASYNREGRPMSVDVTVQMQGGPIDTFGGEIGIEGYAPEQVAATVEYGKRFALAMTLAARPKPDTSAKTSNGRAG